MIENFCTQLEQMDNTDDMWFQQDGATSHTVKTQNLSRTNYSRFGDVPWPDSSQDYQRQITFYGVLKKLCV
jgi:hypothetical protein